MIKLPANWKYKLQFRQFMKSEKGEVGVIILAMRNEHNQVFVYSQSVIDVHKTPASQWAEILEASVSMHHFFATELDTHLVMSSIEGPYDQEALDQHWESVDLGLKPLEEFLLDLFHKVGESVNVSDEAAA